MSLSHTEQSTMKLLYSEFQHMALSHNIHLHLPWALSKIHIFLKEKITSLLHGDMVFRLDLWLGLRTPEYQLSCSGQ